LLFVMCWNLELIIIGLLCWGAKDDFRLID
jgi:hypothetical protein